MLHSFYPQRNADLTTYQKSVFLLWKETTIEFSTQNAKKNKLCAAYPELTHLQYDPWVQISQNIMEEKNEQFSEPENQN